MIRCSAYKISRDDRITILEIRIDYLEDKIKKFDIQQISDLLSSNQQLTANLLLKQKWAEQQGELDEIFNRLEHHSAFYDRFTRIEKLLGKFMELLVNPSDSTYAVREFYRKLKKLIRELNR